MTSIDKEKIKKDGIKLIEEFTSTLKDIPETEETHYVINLKNVTREDGESEGGAFDEKLQKLAPKWEDGYVIAERGS